MIAVSLNVGGGVRLIKPAKLCMGTQNTTNTTRTDARRRVYAAMVPYSRNVVTRIGTHTTDARRPIPRLWIRSAEVRGDVVRRMVTQQQETQSAERLAWDRVFAVHAGSRGFDCHQLHMSERFFRSDRPGYPHPMCSELENSGIRVAVGNCSVAERRWWRPPYQTGKTVHMHANTLQT